MRRIQYWITLRIPLRLITLFISVLALFFARKRAISIARSLLKGKELIGMLPDGSRLAYPLDDFKLLPIISEIYHQQLYTTALDQDFEYVLDVGSHIGLFTLLMSKRAVNARITAFEPNPINYQFLVKNIRLNKLGARVHSYNAAVGHKAGSAVLHFGGTSRGDGSLKDPLHSDATECVEITVIPLDNVLKNDRIVDLAKIDVEGMETEVLLGLEQRYSKIKRFIMEIHLSYVQVSDIHEWLSTHGYEIGRIQKLYDNCLILEAHQIPLLQS